MIFESSLRCTIIGMGQDSFWDLDTRLKFTLFPQYEKLIKPGEGRLTVVPGGRCFLKIRFIHMGTLSINIQPPSGIPGWSGFCGFASDILRCF